MVAPLSRAADTSNFFLSPRSGSRVGIHLLEPALFQVSLDTFIDINDI